MGELPRNVCVKTSKNAHVAQLVERFLGKEEVHRFDSDRGLHYNIAWLAYAGLWGLRPRQVSDVTDGIL